MGATFAATKISGPPPIPFRRSRRTAAVKSRAENRRNAAWKRKELHYRSLFFAGDIFDGSGRNLTSFKNSTEQKIEEGKTILRSAEVFSGEKGCKKGLLLPLSISSLSPSGFVLRRNIFHPLYIFGRAPENVTHDLSNCGRGGEEGDLYRGRFAR